MICIRCVAFVLVRIADLRVLGAEVPAIFSRHNRARGWAHYLNVYFGEWNIMKYRYRTAGYPCSDGYRSLGPRGYWASSTSVVSHDLWLFLFSVEQGKEYAVVEWWFHQTPLETSPWNNIFERFLRHIIHHYTRQSIALNITIKEREIYIQPVECGLDIEKLPTQISSRGDFWLRICLYDRSRSDRGHLLRLKICMQPIDTHLLSAKCMRWIWGDVQVIVRTCPRHWATDVRIARD